MTDDGFATVTRYAIRCADHGTDSSILGEDVGTWATADEAYEQAENQSRIHRALGLPCTFEAYEVLLPATA